MENGHLAIVYAGDYRLKAFTPAGEHVATYGNGRGRGPGRVITLTDGGVWRDSLVYLVDPRQRRVSFFDEEGDFMRAEDIWQYLLPPGLGRRFDEIHGVT